MTGTTQEEVSEEKPWLLHVDGSSTMQGSGAGVVLTTPQGDDLECAIKFDFKASNNKAEYEALVLGMRMALDAGTLHLLAYSDSQLIVKQVSGEYEAKEESMVQYIQQIEELKIKFKRFQLQQIPREENVKADSLSKLASALEDCKTWRITVQHLPQPRIPLDIQLISSNNNDWRTPIIGWINEGHLPENRWEATKIKTRAIRFLTQGGILYKKSFTHPLFRCLSQEKGLHLLQEIHDGCCGSHIGTWTLANKALRARYFWPTMKQDARYLANKCEKCQKHATLIHQPAEPLNVMLSPCPFSQFMVPT
ncbi:UNVERIFIED_CONTAM: Ribonuclease HI [Sesamum latifolium]|uniref:Ribonuclease HI n=1 Tax=Sesamum latifolium TaxID=2727402 RepID=A0AAW2Y6J3_9LAMI